MGRIAGYLLPSFMMALAFLRVCIYVCVCPSTLSIHFNHMYCLTRLVTFILTLIKTNQLTVTIMFVFMFLCM